jgi:hypothetical protein
MAAFPESEVPIPRLNVTGLGVAVMLPLEQSATIGATLCYHGLRYVCAALVNRRL